MVISLSSSSLFPASPRHSPEVEAKHPSTQPNTPPFLENSLAAQSTHDTLDVNATIGKQVETLQHEIKLEKTRLQKTKDFVGKHYGWLLTAAGSVLVAGTWLLNAARLHSAKPSKVEAVVNTLSEAVIHGTPVTKLPKTAGDKVAKGLAWLGGTMVAEQATHSVGSNVQHAEVLEKTPGFLGKLWEALTQHGHKLPEVVNHVAPHLH